jgi:hypothetical protein
MTMTEEEKQTLLDEANHAVKQSCLFVEENPLDSLGLDDRQLMIVSFYMTLHKFQGVIIGMDAQAAAEERIKRHEEMVESLDSVKAAVPPDIENATFVDDANGMKGILHCPHCGAAHQFPRSDRFCLGCGEEPIAGAWIPKDEYIRKGE